jgi:hypothetical protein
MQGRKDEPHTKAQLVVDSGSFVDRQTVLQVDMKRGGN